MDIGSEIGQKMRSAVKAKLCELGAGYIDEELPDYVMILLVNKKSRTQMADALNLFLGDNTTSFVDWLHEVLDKLQKVTLPKKQKSGDSEKKDRKKKERKQKEAPDTNKSSELPVLPPITDVIKEGFLKRAQQDMELEATVKTKKQDTEPGDGNDGQNDTAVEENQSSQTQQQVDLQQLEEIQKKIYATKQQLRNMVSDEDSSDGDEVADHEENLSDYIEEDGNPDGNQTAPVEQPVVEEEPMPPTPPPPPSTNIPIDQSSPKRPSIHVNPNFLNRREKITGPEVHSSSNPELVDHDSVEDDIASDTEPHNDEDHTSNRVIKLSAVRRAEREIYVPKFRRIEMLKRISRAKAESFEESKRPSNPVHNRVQTDRRENRSTRFDVRRRLEPRRRTRSPPRTRTPPKRQSRSPLALRRRTRTPPLYKRRSRTPPLHHNQRPPSPKSTKSLKTEEEMRRELLRKRVGSKVTVAPPRPPSEEVDVAINSQITVKPRPKVPAEKQASKMLLLKAMAEAQLSTIRSKKRPRSPIPLKNRSKRGLHGNIVIQVPHLEDEYVPAPIGTGIKTGLRAELENYKASIARKDDTQFVVTLSGIERTNANKRRRNDESDAIELTIDNNDADEEEQLAREAVQKTIEDKPKRSVKDRIGFRMRVEEDEETKRRRKERFDSLYERKEASPVKKSRSRSHSPVKPRNYRGARESSYERDRANRSDRDYNRRYDGNRRDSGRRNESRYDSPRHNSLNRHDSPDGRYGATNRPDGDARNELNRRDNNNRFYNNNVVHPHPKVQELVDNESRHSSNTPPLIRRHRARTVSPINFDLTDEETRSHDSDDDFESRVNKENEGDKKPVAQVKKLESSKKFDNVPALLSAVTVTDSSGKVKLKERCKFFPHCTNGESCDYHHPNTPCMSFPICKYGDKCLYLHPKCKFDEHCVRSDCPYMHTVSIVISAKGPAAPLASSVVPVQSYKSLNLTPLPPICKFYPNCSNLSCHFFHPKPCKFGKNCMNKIECNFYHHDIPTMDKMKWVSPAI